mmetsp:Transcript_43302/g.74978  ORF Transcript_43302/g.74978 Transcript_43302/m.74978 type:complete len:107 (+) Transcript_43302:245-565(+)
MGTKQGRAVQKATLDNKVKSTSSEDSDGKTGSQRELREGESRESKLDNSSPFLPQLSSSGSSDGRDETEVKKAVAKRALEGMGGGRSGGYGTLPWRPHLIQASTWK